MRNCVSIITAEKQIPKQQQETSQPESIHASDLPSAGFAYVPPGSTETRVGRQAPRDSFPPRPSHTARASPGPDHPTVGTVHYRRARPDPACQRDRYRPVSPVAPGQCATVEQALRSAACAQIQARCWTFCLTESGAIEVPAPDSLRPFLHR